jgi:hypothetical protein
VPKEGNACRFGRTSASAVSSYSVILRVKRQARRQTSPAPVSVARHRLERCCQNTRRCFATVHPWRQGVCDHKRTFQKSGQSNSDDRASFDAVTRFRLTGCHCCQCNVRAFDGTPPCSDLTRRPWSAESSRGLNIVEEVAEGGGFLIRCYVRSILHRWNERSCRVSAYLGDGSTFLICSRAPLLLPFCSLLPYSSYAEDGFLSSKENTISTHTKYLRSTLWHAIKKQPVNKTWRINSETDSLCQDPHCKGLQGA